MKKTRITFFTLFLISVLLYFLTDSDFAFYFMIFAAVYTLIALLIVKASGRNLTFSLEGASQGMKGEPVNLKMVMDNRSLLPILCCRVRIKTENILLGTEEVQELVTSMWPIEKKITNLDITENHIGCVRISVESAELRDSIGLFRKDCLNTAYAEYLIFPQMSELQISREMFLSYDMESYKYSKTKKGADLSEVFDVREYMPGDSIKAIHWKLSAKTDSMMIKVPSLPVENSLMIVLDNNLNGFDSEADRGDKIEELVNMFMSVSYTLIKQGLQHSMGWYDLNDENYEHHNIRHNDDLYNTAALVVKSPFGEDKICAAERLLNADFDKPYAAYIYVTHSGKAEKEVERLREYGEVYIYRPDNYK